MQAYYDHWRNTPESIIGVTGLVGSVAFQPMPKANARRARDMGGDLINLDDNVDRIVMEYDYSYILGLDDRIVDAAVVRFFSGMRELVLAFIDNGTLSPAYLPLFMNDAYFCQDYWGRLDTTDFARRIKDHYDPSGFFTQQTAGWKL